MDDMVEAWVQRCLAAAEQIERDAGTTMSSIAMPLVVEMQEAANSLGRQEAKAFLREVGDRLSAEVPDVKAIKVKGIAGKIALRTRHHEFLHTVGTIARKSARWK